MSRLTQGGTAKPVSQDQILRRELGQGKIHCPCLADPEQDRQLYPVDPYSSAAVVSDDHTGGDMCVSVGVCIING